MTRKILFSLLTLILLSGYAYSQVLTVNNISATSHFDNNPNPQPQGCNSPGLPIVTAEFTTGTGTTAVGGNLVCQDPCGETTITIHLSNVRWHKNNTNNWLHGISFPANAGFTVTGVNLPSHWFAFPGCTGASCSAQTTVGPGFFFDGTGQSCCTNTLDDGNPSNNYGDPVADCGVDYAFDFKLTLCNSSIQPGNNVLLFRVRGTADGNTGCWSQADNLVPASFIQFTITTVGCTQQVFSTNPATTPVTYSCATGLYTSNLAATCGNGQDVTWWSAATGGTLLHTGSPWVYTSAACPTGFTAYAQCCPNGTNCASRKPATIGACPPTIALGAPVVTQPTCTTPTGSIDASGSVTNGIPPYTFTLNPGGSNTTGIFTGLAPGPYTLTVTDAAGCSAATTVTINPVTGATFTPSSTTVAASCPGVNNGSITVTVVPAGTYTYVLDGNAATTNSTGIFPNVSGGAHTVTVANATCNTTININVGTGAALTSTASHVNTSCNNATNGTMTATPTNGTAPYTYTINATPTNVTGLNSGTFTGLAPGVYIITFTDANGCQGTATQTITAGLPLTATIANTGASCPGINNGTVTVTAPNGTAPYSYTINATPANTTGAATGVFTGLAGGTYTVTFTDANGCTGTATTTVATGAALTSTSSHVNTSCNNATNGTMTATPTNGTAPYTYTINATPANTTGLNSGTFTGLAAGTFIITFTDANGCQGTTTQTVAAGPALTATITSTGAACPGINNGTVTVTAPTGTAPFSYTINATPANTTGAASGVFTGLAGAPYTVTFTDANGCTGTATTTVTTSPALTSTSSHVNTSCNNATNGTMTATPTNGTAPYTYTINATPANTTGLNSGIFTGLAAGTYIITFTDANGCTGTATEIIAAGPALAATITNTGASCPGINNGTVTVTAPTGTAPFSYTINATPANTTGASTGVFTGLPGGAYTVTFTDAGGCTGTAATTVATGAAITVTSSTTGTSTTNASDGTMTAAGSGGTAPYGYTINATPANTTGATSGVFTGLPAGSYTITVTDANGCTGTTTLTVAPGPGLTAAVSTTATSCPTVNNGSVTLTAPTGVGPWSYTINATPTNTTGATTGVFTGLASGSYSITVTDANGSSGIVNATVAAGAALTSTSSVTATSCNNATNGSMTAAPAAGSGTAPFTYTINATPANTSGATTGTFTNLAPGAYIITFTDANGCTGTANQTVLAGPALTATSSTTATACPTVNNGTLTVTAPTGTAPFSYTINATPANTTGAATGVFTGLAGGSYVVTFTDASGCTGTVNNTVATGAGITANSSFTATSCNAATDGTMTATPAAGSGTAPFAYTINATPANTTGAATGTFTGLAAGTYIITFTDANGCTGTTTQTITAGSSLSATAATTGTACPTVNNGTLTVTAPTGTAPFAYTINATPANTTGAATGVFTGLAAGTYTVTFTDANACSGTVTATVAAGLPITASSSVVNTSCNNAVDGSMTATPTAGSGTAPFAYTINATPANTTGAASGTFTGLAPGTYIITFTDANACSGTVSGTVAAGAALTATATTTGTACPAVNNGTLTVTAPTGTAPFSYTINATPANTTGATTGVFTGLAAGPYTVTFTAANACTGTVTATVAAGLPITATSSVVNTSCNNAVDGSMNATPDAGSGTAPFSYTINATPANTTGAATGTFTGLAPGPYVITFTDANGCTGTTGQTLLAGPDLTATASTTATACPTVNNGTLTVTAPTGVAPFSYTINATPANTTGASTGIFTGLPSGPYTVTFTAANGCTGTVNATVAQGAAITATGSKVNTSCNNAVDGSMTANPAGGTGTAPFTYTIDATPTNTTGAATGTFTGLAAGTYNITFTDANGCTGTVTQTIAPGSALAATPATTGTACPGIDNGTFTATAPTGVAPFTYTIDAVPANTTGASTGVFTGLAAGTYNITFTASNGCTGTISGTVAQGAALTSTAASVNPNCSGIDDGTFTVTPTNGAAPYTYTIDAVPANTTGAATGVFTGLAPGTYIITFTDANGCTGTQAKTLTTNAPITTPEAHTDVKCFGGTDGTITLTPVGGVGPYSYALLPSTTFQASSTITGLSAGPHTIRVKDNVGCTKDTTINIAEPVQLTASAVKDNNATCEGNDGGITVTAAGGTTPYEYSIDNGVTYQATGVFTNATNTTYAGNIKVKDANGCTATANSVTVGQDNNLTLDILTNPDTTICQGSSVKFAPVLTNAGAEATYSWTSLTPVVPNSTIDLPNTLDATVSPVDTAIYKLTVTYKACTISDNVPVNVIWKPIVNAGPSAVSICLGDSVLLIGSVTHTSGPIDSLVWSPTDSLTTPVSNQTWAHPVNNTYYHLTAFTSIANYGCVFAPQAYDSIKVVIPAPVIASAGRDTIAVKGQPHQLLGSGGVSYTWSSPTATIANPLAQNPFVTLYNDANFSVIVKNAIGCADTAHVFVQVLDGPAYYVPNAFSPNGDGLNDVFRAIPAGMANTEYFKVMNRYGETVFETNQYLKGWDGTFKGKKQPLGVYVWMVKGQDKDGKKVEMKGTVMLVQ